MLKRVLLVLGGANYWVHRGFFWWLGGGVCSWVLKGIILVFEGFLGGRLDPWKGLMSLRGSLSP